MDWMFLYGDFGVNCDWAIAGSDAMTAKSCSGHVITYTNFMTIKTKWSAAIKTAFDELDY